MDVTVRVVKQPLIQYSGQAFEFYLFVHFDLVVPPVIAVRRIQ